MSADKTIECNIAFPIKTLYVIIVMLLIMGVGIFLYVNQAKSYSLKYVKMQEQNAKDFQEIQKKIHELVELNSAIKSAGISQAVDSEAAKKEQYFQKSLSTLLPMTSEDIAKFKAEQRRHANRPLVVKQYNVNLSNETAIQKVNMDYGFATVFIFEDEHGNPLELSGVTFGTSKVGITGTVSPVKNAVIVNSYDEFTSYETNIIFTFKNTKRPIIIHASLNNGDSDAIDASVRFNVKDVVVKK